MSWGTQIKWFFLALRGSFRAAVHGVSNAVSIRLSQFAPPATAFVSQPEPRSYGVGAHGAQMLAGNFLVDGAVLERPGQSPWMLSLEGSPTEQTLHGFAWLDDVVAVDTKEAHQKAQAWVFEWIEQYGSGRGPGWVPDLTGRRVVRWINHAVLILNHSDPQQSRKYFQSLGHQARFLMRRWKSMPAGLPRFEALTGLVYCGLALEGQSAFLGPALTALGRECQREIRSDGGIESRNPEELMEIFTLLSWVNQAVSANGKALASDILHGLERMAPAIRALRLGDGGMARFHGGGTGQAERIDRGLADSGIRTAARAKGVMGYSRIAAGRTLIVMDTGRLPVNGGSKVAHASTLAFEMSSGQVSFLVSMGSAVGFDQKLQSASRATAAHNALVVGGASSARFAGSDWLRHRLEQQLVDGPTKVNVQHDSNEFGHAVLASHDGYVRSHGLVHTRQIAVVHGGNEVQGEDRVAAHSARDKVRFMKKAQQVDGGETLPFTLPFTVHFRAHPDVKVNLDMGGTSASFHLPNGEVWLLRANGAKLEVKDTIHFELGRLKPRATKQVVVSGQVIDYEGGVSWILSRPV